ncbi:MAG: peptidyl-prolyl cis-trans isomerase [Planctomycetes bacterium]|nr:peptidyl-prolyl cis-trans isomerase [Planctomycetota bacterium]MBU4400139.1 peptidyl-prolyl cis-trans isomerase [Planctomycetota bacterium]
MQPTPPERPSPASRPPSWPGREGESSPWVPPEKRIRQPQTETTPGNNLKPCPGTTIIARVGSEVILESDVLGAVNEMIEKNKDGIPPDQLEAQRTILIVQRLKSHIEAKLILQDAKRTIPPEGWERVQEQLKKEFEENQLGKMIQSAEVNTRHELDLKLRALGTSLDQEKRAFCERTLAQQWIQQQVKRDKEITYERMIGYYHTHLDEFAHPARARWEELIVRYSDCPSKAAARDAIARLGNQVLAGAPLAEVAKRGSGGPTAADGGRRRWTTKGSLVCEELDRALFSLPIGQLSPIIEGPNGWHIVRVIEREEASVTPFREAQVGIREKIVRKKMEEQFREYMAKLEAQTPVWTIFDKADGRPLLSNRPEEYR